MTSQTMTLLDALDGFAEGRTVAALTLDEELLYDEAAAGEIVIALAGLPQICRFAISDKGKPMMFHEV